MKSQNEKKKLTELQRKATKQRFQIEKLEERIAPGGHGHGHGHGHGRDGGCHYNPHGKMVGRC